jgi:hypothetical protein
MSFRVRLSSSVTKFIATPFLPKRPPRPILVGKKGKKIQISKQNNAWSKRDDKNNSNTPTPTMDKHFTSPFNQKSSLQ